MPSQGAPSQHSPASGPSMPHRDPTHGDDDTTVSTQSADTLTAPPPTQHTADPGTNTPTTPQQSPQNTPQGAGPIMGAPTVPAQGGGAHTPTTAPPRGGTPQGTGPGSPNRRPDGSRPIQDASPQRTQDRPAYNPRPTTPQNGRPDPRLPQPDTNRPDPRQQPSQNNQPPQQRPPSEPRTDTPQRQDTPSNSEPNNRPDNNRRDNEGTDGERPNNNRPDSERPDSDRPTQADTRPDDRPTDHADNPTPDTNPDSDAKPEPGSNTDNTDAKPDSDSDAKPDSDTDTDTDTKPDSDSDTDANSDADPTPASETRNRDHPGGLDGPTDEHQQHVEDSVPKDENGDPQRHPDPDDGNWVGTINEPGSDAPGRNNNCVDAALATADTYSGNPTAAAHRTPDTNPDGTPSDRGENNGRDRIENTLGARFNDYGNGRDAFNRLENDLRNSGHGSQAVIVTQDRNGRAHAWNVVNHNGKITYVDAQTGKRSDKPLHDGSNGVHAIPLDPNRRPVNGDSSTQKPGNESDRRPAAEPAGSGDGKKRERSPEDMEIDEGDDKKRPRRDNKSDPADHSDVEMPDAPHNQDDPDGERRPPADPAGTENDKQPGEKDNTQDKTKDNAQDTKDNDKDQKESDEGKDEKQDDDNDEKGEGKDDEKGEDSDEGSDKDDEYDGLIRDEPDDAKFTAAEAQKLVDSQPQDWDDSDLGRMVERARLDHGYFQQYAVPGSAADQHTGKNNFGMSPSANYAAFRYVVEPDSKEYVMLARSFGTSGNVTKSDDQPWTGKSKHSERAAVEYLQHMQSTLPDGQRIRLVEVYTERAPCAQKGCAALMYRVFGKVPTTHTLPHPDDGSGSAEMRKHINDLKKRRGEILGDDSRHHAAGRGPATAPDSPESSDGE
ncbi:hypothetical protein DY245_01565 [Streptomyces inhibens]|uniref:Tox-PL domain-containing protein n=3 Tax=Streptomyces inhibens TaxID=2293571 RepID=A0A371QBC7_STRIH|nr:hypothetical protein DY245_01565 [Streptomyces inhibens]